MLEVVSISTEAVMELTCASQLSVKLHFSSWQTIKRKREYSLYRVNGLDSRDSYWSGSCQSRPSSSLYSQNEKLT